MYLTIEVIVIVNLFIIDAVSFPARSSPAGETIQEPKISLCALYDFPGLQTINLPSLFLSPLQMQ